MAYKVIPQVEFDKAVQQVLALGVNRKAAENIVLSLWKASIDLNLNFKLLVQTATATGSLDVSQSILDHINKTLPPTIQYHRAVPAAVSPIAKREL
jgi:hypothetical protein